MGNAIFRLGALLKGLDFVINWANFVLEAPTPKFFWNHFWLKIKKSTIICA